MLARWCSVVTVSRVRKARSRADSRSPMPSPLLRRLFGSHGIVADMRRLMAIMAVLLGTVALLAGCGSSDSNGSNGSTGTTDGSGGSSSKPLVVDITFSGQTVTPNGERVKVGVGQKVE